LSKFKNQISKLTRQLFPTGRSFSGENDDTKKKLYDALSESMDRAVYDSALTLDSVLPDNDNFTADDAARWEERLGMITNTSVSLADRKAAIIVKLNHPGDIPARQSPDYLEDRLRAAGFDVYVHENPLGLTPSYVISEALSLWQMGDTEAEMGEVEMGSAQSVYPSLFQFSEMGVIEMGSPEMGDITYNNIIANRINELADSTFNYGNNLKRTFFIGRDVLGNFANVDASRKDEFRQLILKTKPVRTVGFLFINYV
jgi:uncharacterized protein YmfQ (DUF2313 family)